MDSLSVIPASSNFFLIEKGTVNQALTEFSFQRGGNNFLTKVWEGAFSHKPNFFDETGRENKSVFSLKISIIPPRLLKNCDSILQESNFKKVGDKEAENLKKGGLLRSDPDQVSKFKLQKHSKLEFPKFIASVLFIHQKLLSNEIRPLF